MTEIETVGFTVATKDGCKASPTVKIAMGLVVELRRMASEFGFSPASRSRIDVQRPAGIEEDEFEKL
jgi:P27 family predicted phage terminase small subunit